MEPQKFADIEKGSAQDAHLQNTTVANFAWQNVTVTVDDRLSKLPRALVEDVTGVVNAGMIPQPLMASTVPSTICVNRKLTSMATR